MTKERDDRVTRRPMSAGRVFMVMVICLLTWMLLAAPLLRTAAEGSPIGVRRSVSLFFLRPLDGLTHLIGLDNIQESVARATGHEVTGQAEIAPVPIASREPGHGGSPSPSPSFDLTAPLRTPTRQDPLRVAVVGDSLATEVGYGLQQIVDPHLVDVQVRGVNSTGLSRPDYFDWPANLQQVVSRFDPDVVVVVLGLNDAQNITTVGKPPITVNPRSPWESEYRNRVDAFIHVATDSGARVAWVGLPPVKDAGLNGWMQIISGLYASAAGSIPGAIFVPLYERFSGRDGKYSAYLPDENGTQQLVRAPDGEHLTVLGGVWAAEEVLKGLQNRWGLQGNSAKG